MVRKINKGSKVPYNGFLLNKGEYEEYQKYLDLLPDILQAFRTTDGGKKV